jgi:drug/metabolite transporter (DMT)-like permease
LPEGGLLGPVLLMFGLGDRQQPAQRVSAGDPVRLASVKGVVAGLVNTGFGLAGRGFPGGAAVAAAMLLGLVGYGLSVALFVAALRHLGTARTGAYFSLAPFMGAAFAVVLLHERVVHRHHHYRDIHHRHRH